LCAAICLSREEGKAQGIANARQAKKAPVGWQASRRARGEAAKLRRVTAELARTKLALNESLEREGATAEILKVIASSPSDVRPVFDAIARSARRLFGAHSATVVRRIDDMLHLAAFTATTKSGDAALRKRFPTKLTGEGAVGKAMLSRKPAWVADFQTDPAYSAKFRREVRERGYRSLLAVPMMRDGEAIGGIAITRRAAGPFYRPADQSAANVRRPGGDRDRERAAVQRDEGGARAADGNERNLVCDQQIADRCATRLRYDRGQRAEALRRELQRRPAV
jgi:hypothetical protein